MSAWSLPDLPTPAAEPNGGHASGYVRALALDFDGTISSDGKAPSAPVVEALGRARRAGLRVVLVTGRILRELYGVWPAVMSSVDCVVAENGAVLSAPDCHRLLGPPVDPRLDAALAAAGVQFRRGEALLAASLADEPTVLHAVRSLHLDCQTVANRGELMVLGAGLSKGTGLHRALGQLGLSFHNTIAVGDAENDLSLLEHCELGVAVANAVEPLAARADLVLADGNGTGVERFITASVLSSHDLPPTRRWRMRLGRTDQGEDVVLPSSRINVLLTGGTGSGKSYLAGLMAEQLIDQDYSVLVVDPEGDHVGLGRLPGTFVVGGGPALPEPDDVLRLLHHRYGSVVVDLSGVDGPLAGRFQQDLVMRVEAHRRQTGLPHWVFLDEADRLLGRSSTPLPGLDPVHKGYCLVTWRPERLTPETVAALDVVVATAAGDPEDCVAGVVAGVGDATRAEVARLLAEASPAGSSVRAVVAQRQGSPRLAAFAVVQRTTRHLRHQHKYESRRLDAEHCFHFRQSSDERTGAVAANLLDLETVLATCERDVLRHHCPRHDFSRWVADVFHDDTLARLLEAAESTVDAGSPGAVVEEGRLALLAAVEDRLRT